MRSYLLFGALLSALGSAASAQNFWTNPGTGDWHDPDNWSLGVPVPQQWVQISNGGSAQISQDNLGPLLVAVYDGAVELVAGDWQGVIQMEVGRSSAGSLSAVTTTPRFTISPGSTAGIGLVVGEGEHLIDHLGGTLNLRVLRTVGTYRLSGGELNVASDSLLLTGSEMIVSGDALALMGRLILEGSFLQTSGGLQVTSSEVRLPEGHLRIEGGTAQLGDIRMFQGGTIDVAGGEVTMGRLWNLPDTSDPSNSGNVNVSAGTLRLTNSIDPISTIPEFFAGDWTLDVPTGFATLHRANFVDVSAAKLKTGPETLVTLPAGITPDHFASTEIEGIVHTSGSPLVIPAGRVLRGVGYIDDPLVVHGEISARNLAGGNHVVSLDASQGIQVHAGGVADLAGGRVTVKDNVSGVFGGELRLGTLIVGGLETTTEQYEFTQTGGLVGPSLLAPGSVSELILTLPAGARYTIEQGTINLASASIGHAGGTGLFLQNDGDVTFGTITLGASGPGDGGRYELHGGTLRSTTTRVLNEFVQTGGLHLAESVFSSEVRVAEQDTTGLYDLQGGTHIVKGRVRIGAYARSTATYRVGTEGTLEARQIEVLGPGQGTLEVAGGTAHIDHLQIGSGGPGSHWLKITQPGSVISIKESLTLAANSTFEAVPGTTIHMTRASLRIQATDAQKLLGLNHTTLVFDGAAGVVNQLEVAGLDMGPTSEGYSGNFSLAGLVVGESSPAQVRLVDLSNNHALLEALYVRELWIGPGSNLDLNGLNLYYGKLHMDATALVTLNGGTFQLQAVPEPTGALSLLGMVGMIALRAKVAGATRMPRRH